MIKVEYKKVDNVIETIKINGHAMYDDKGKDIVCAGVSTALTTTINAILAFDKNSIEYKGENPFILNNIKKDDITNKLLENLLDILIQIETKYQENIIVKEI